MHASRTGPRGSGPSSRDLIKCLATRFGSYGQYELVTKLGRPLAFKMHLPKCLGHFEVLTESVREDLDEVDLDSFYNVTT